MLRPQAAWAALALRVLVSRALDPAAAAQGPSLHSWKKGGGENMSQTAEAGGTYGGTCRRAGLGPRRCLGITESATLSPCLNKAL